MSKKKHKQKRRVAIPHEFHGDMSNVPTSKREDGFRHMKTSPEQFPLSNWEHDWKWKGKSFEDICEALRKRKRHDREEILWTRVESRNQILGRTPTREFMISRTYQRMDDQIGFRYFVWWSVDGGWNTRDFGFLTPGMAMQYAQDHLTARVSPPVERHVELEVLRLSDFRK